MTASKTLVVRLSVFRMDIVVGDDLALWLLCPAGAEAAPEFGVASAERRGLYEEPQTSADGERLLCLKEVAGVRSKCAT